MVNPIKTAPQKRNYTFRHPKWDKSSPAVVEATNRILNKNGVEKQLNPLNLSEDLKQTVLDDARFRIKEYEKSKEELMPEYNLKNGEFEEAKKIFEEASKEYNEIKAKLSTLDALIHKRQLAIETFSMGHKEIRTTDPVHKNSSGHRSTKRVSWLKAVYDIIERNDKFMSFGEIWLELGKDTVIKESAAKTKSGFDHMKKAVENNLIIHAGYFGKGRKSGPQYLSIYQDKFGLSDWMNERDHSLKEESTKRVLAFMG